MSSPLTELKSLVATSGTILILQPDSPVGSDLEYADQITLGRALQGRQIF